MSSFKAKANKGKVDSTKKVENKINQDISKETEKEQTMVDKPKKVVEKQSPIEKAIEENKTPEKTFISMDATPKFEVIDDKNDFNPFADQPIIRDSGLAGNQSDNTQPITQEPVIPEPNITPDDGEISSVGNMGDNKTIDANQNNDSEIFNNVESNEENQNENINPAMNALPDADRLKAAKAAATEITNLYCTYKPELFKWISKPNKKKINKLVADGELDLNVKIETEDGEVNTLKNYLHAIDVQAETVFNPSDDFRERLIPPLTEVLLKRNIGLTPEQQCIAIVAQDAGTSVIQLVQLKKYTSTLIEHASDLTRQIEVNMKQRDDEIDRLKKQLDEQTKRADKAEKIVNKVVPDAEIVGSKPLENKNKSVDEGDTTE